MESAIISTLKNGNETPIDAAGRLVIPTAVRQDAEMICGNVRLGTKLIVDVLDLKRLSLGTLQVQSVPVDMTEVVLWALDTHTGAERWRLPLLKSPPLRPADLVHATLALSREEKGQLF